MICSVQIELGEMEEEGIAHARLSNAGREMCV